MDLLLAFNSQQPDGEVEARPDRLRKMRSNKGTVTMNQAAGWIRRPTWWKRSGSPVPVRQSNLATYQSAGQHYAGVSGYVRWPHPASARGSAEERSAYFHQLHSAASADIKSQPTAGRQAITLLELMTIRAYHSKTLRRHSLGTALGFRTRNGKLTDLPAIIVFVSRKVHEQWLLESQKLPSFLHGPSGFWCEVDVVEFSYYGQGNTLQREQVYSDLLEGLRGSDAVIGPGSQVASEEMYGTFGAVVRSKKDPHRVGFLTNRHVAVDFDQPKQKMYHPLPPSLGPGNFLGSVERATSFASDDVWYGVFVGENPETFVRADGAFIPFRESFDLSKVTTILKGVGEIGKAHFIHLADPVSSIVGCGVVKLGGSSGLTKGTIMAYAVEYNDDKGVCFLTDFLILGENGSPFDMEGDSGSLIVLEPKGDGPYRPVGIIWGGTANRGRLKLRSGHGPENWTSAVDIGRLLDLLELDLVTSMDEFHEAHEGPQKESAVADVSTEEVSQIEARLEQANAGLAMLASEQPDELPAKRQRAL